MYNDNNINVKCTFNYINRSCNDINCKPDTGYLEKVEREKESGFYTAFFYTLQQEFE